MSKMPLWLAGSLFLIFAAVLAILIVLERRKGKKSWIIAAIAVSCVALLATLIYAALTFIFIDAASNQPLDEPPETSAAIAPATPPTSASPIPYASSEAPTSETPIPETPTPLPDD
ncbi:MAG: hypothetical protein LBS84_09065, partial [Clostridiales bacterium]|nr:hypothetical protein [Clostridiales bacterium]